MKKKIILLFSILFFISCGRIGEYQVVWEIQKPSQELIAQVLTEIQGIKVINDGNFHNPVKDENAFNNNFKDLLKNKKLEAPEIAIIYKDGNIKTYQAKIPYLQRDNVIYLQRNLTPYYRVIIPYWMYKIQK